MNVVRKLELMHRQFGKTPGKTCGTCSNLSAHFYDKTYYKCRVYGSSASEATDWAKRWEACGCYNKDWSGGKIKELVKHAPRKEPRSEIEGQISLLEDKT